MAAGALAESTQEMLTAAQAAYVRGDVETAKKTFLLISKTDPKNQTAIGYLRMIAAQEAKGPAENATRKQLDKLIVPKIEFREATLGSVLDFLKQAALKNSDGKVAVNFVVQLPEDVVKTQTVTLSLTNIPFNEVLKYVGGLANVEFTFDKYAIIVKPHNAAAPATTQPGQ